MRLTCDEDKLYAGREVAALKAVRTKLQKSKGPHHIIEYMDDYRRRSASVQGHDDMFIITRCTSCMHPEQIFTACPHPVACRYLLTRPSCTSSGLLQVSAWFLHVFITSGLSAAQCGLWGHPTGCMSLAITVMSFSQVCGGRAGIQGFP